MTNPSIRKGPSGPLAAFELTTDDVENVSNLNGGTGSLTDALDAIDSGDVLNVSIVDGATVTDALDTLAARAPHYLDTDDGPIGLWNFDGTLNAVVGPNFAVAAGTAVGFTEIIPGFTALTAGPGVRLACPADASLRLAGDMTIELLLMLEDIDAGQVLVSMGFTGAGAPDNKLYEMSNPSAVYPRNMSFNWESGVAVARSFATPTAALSPSVPPVHIVSIWGWTRASNVLTPYLNGSPFSAASGVQVAPAGGGNGILTMFADANNVNISFSAVASLAIYDRAKSAAEMKASYNRALGDFWGIIP